MNINEEVRQNKTDSLTKFHGLLKKDTQEICLERESWGRIADRQVEKIKQDMRFLAKTKKKLSIRTASKNDPER